jgi:hypothetical protein
MKLSKKQGLEIAKAYNSLNVAFDMYHQPSPVVQAKPWGDQQEYKRRWLNNLREARDTLKAMGIPVIGYDHY